MVTIEGMDTIEDCEMIWFRQDKREKRIWNYFICLFRWEIYKTCELNFNYIFKEHASCSKRIINFIHQYWDMVIICKIF